jgi:hypothetical protein
MVLSRNPAGQSPAPAREEREGDNTLRMYAAWVSSAKKPETRQKRPERSIGFLAENKRLVDVFGIKKKE